jgi:hypothetical protein
VAGLTSYGIEKDEDSDAKLLSGSDEDWFTIEDIEVW